MNKKSTHVANISVPTLTGLNKINFSSTKLRLIKLNQVAFSLRTKMEWGEICPFKGADKESCIFLILVKRKSERDVPFFPLQRCSQSAVEFFQNLRNLESNPKSFLSLKRSGRSCLLSPSRKYWGSLRAFKTIFHSKKDTVCFFFCHRWHTTERKPSYLSMHVVYYAFLYISWFFIHYEAVLQYSNPVGPKKHLTGWQWSTSVKPKDLLSSYFSLIFLQFLSPTLPRTVQQTFPRVCNSQNPSPLKILTKKDLVKNR